MEPSADSLVMYGRRAPGERLGWRWVHDQLDRAGAYWIVMRGAGHPHPRPVWGIWCDHQLALSIGSPRISADAQVAAPVTVHLGSVNDVVIVEGTVVGRATDSELLEMYNAKYDWNYTIAEYGPLTIVAPRTVIAWRSAGWAGRDGFQATGRWTYPSNHS